MNNTNQIIDDLFNFLLERRYVAIYQNDELTFKQRKQTSDSSSSDTHKYE